MKIGTIIEYIDKQKIIIGTILSLEDTKVKILNEEGKVFNISPKRFSHISKNIQIDSQDVNVIENLLTIKALREEKKNKIDIKSIWTKINNISREWINLDTISKLIFDDAGDNETASVIRAFFEDRVYFKFKEDRFKPRNSNGIEEQKKKQEQEDGKKRIVQDGSAWLKDFLEGKKVSEVEEEVVEILKDFYLFGKDSKTSEEAKKLLKKIDLKQQDIFDLMVKLKEWDENENLDILRENIKKDFPEQLLAEQNTFFKRDSLEGRKDLTSLDTLTIDAQTTTDFDDAITIQKNALGYTLYVHIADVAHYIKKGDSFDLEAFKRVSSIYTPDDKIYMFPPFISEELCSLKKGKTKFTITTAINFSSDFEIISSEVFPSVIRVNNQTSYTKALKDKEDDEDITTLYQLSRAIKNERFQNGAMQISLPEVNVFFNKQGVINITKTERENPIRDVVAEIMIIANNKMAEFLSDHKVPAIFRTQPKPKKRIIQSESSNLFENVLQKKFLNRTFIKSTASPHTGLGVGAYITATSPIRRYFDIVNQRQIRAIFNLDTFYEETEIIDIYEKLEQKLKTNILIQNSRKRFWILKYLENKIGTKTPAIVIDKKRDFYIIMLEEYIIECKLFAEGVLLKPEDRIQVTIQHSNARRDILSVYL